MNEIWKEYVNELRQKLQFDFTLPGSEKELENMMEQDVIDSAAKLIPHVAARMGLRQTQLQRQISKINLKMIHEVNGYTRTSDGWKTFEIDINVGLRMFIHQMAMLFATRIGFMEEGKPTEESPVSFQESVSIAKNLMEKFWEGNILLTEFFPTARLTRKQILFLAQLNNQAESFVLAHEFGHVVINLSHGNVDELQQATNFVAHALESVRGLNDTQKALTASQWGEEIGADLIALRLCLNLESDNLGRVMRFSTAEWVFIIQNMLETFYEKTTGERPPLGTHPSSQMRLDVLRVVSDSNPAWALQLGKDFEQMSELILAAV